MKWHFLTKPDAPDRATCAELQEACLLSPAPEDGCVMRGRAWLYSLNLMMAPRASHALTISALCPLCFLSPDHRLALLMQHAIVMIHRGVIHQ